MDENTKKQAYFDWLKIYTNNAYLKSIKDYYESPDIIKIAIDKMILYENKDASIQSEAIADLKISYFERVGIPEDICNLISPYFVRKVKFI